MVNELRLNVHQKSKIRIIDLLLCGFAFWPFFWSLWGVLKFPNETFGSLTSVYILWGITILFLLSNRRLVKSSLNVWIYFLIVIIGEMVLSHSFGARYNISVILCGFIICASSVDKEFEYLVILKCLYHCGLFICMSVLIEEFTGLFSTVLVQSIYTNDSIAVILRHNGSGGGLLPHSSSAGCFIYAGAVAYLTIWKIKKTERLRVIDIVIFSLFIICMVLIRKRGFLFDSGFALLAVWAVGLKQGDLHKIKVRKQIKTLGILLIIAIVLVLAYHTVPLVKTNFDLLVSKFLKEDITSGRTKLYSFALQLFRRNVLTGIGWGNFRRNTVGFFGLSDVSYAVHNVYLQLLCETGIIGLTAFLITIVCTLRFGIIKYRALIECGNLDQKKNIIKCGLFLQFFFIAYCITGNPLYDYNFLITYFIGILMTTIPIGIHVNKLGRSDNT